MVPIIWQSYVANMLQSCSFSHWLPPFHVWFDHGLLACPPQLVGVNSPYRAQPHERRNARGWGFPALVWRLKPPQELLEVLMGCPSSMSPEQNVTISNKTYYQQNVATVLSSDCFFQT